MTEAQSPYLNREPRTLQQAMRDAAELRQRYAHILRPWVERDLPAMADGSYTAPLAAPSMVKQR